MSYHTYETEIDDGLFCTVVIAYDFQPAEPMVRYYPDGSGYPGAPAEVEICDVLVTSIETKSINLDREHLKKIGGGSWCAYFDKLAFEYIEKHCNNGEPLLDDLISNAIGEEY